MKVFVVTHDQGVDGGRAVAVYATVEGATAFVEAQSSRFPKLKKVTLLSWDSLGDSFYIDEFDVIQNWGE